MRGEGLEPRFVGRGGGVGFNNGRHTGVQLLERLNSGSIDFIIELVD